MATFIAFLTANATLIVGVVFAIISLLTAIFNKNERVVGILGIIRVIIERLSGLQPRNSAGTLKIPGAKPAPAVKEDKPTPVLK